MKATQPLIFSALILGALSTTQMDAFARFEHHSEHEGDFAAAKDFNRSDSSKLHAILDHSGGESSSFVTSEIHKKGPEIVTLEGSIQGYAHEDIVGVKHPESKKKSAAETSCAHKPGQPGC
jgi:hypothetical protein